MQPRVTPLLFHKQYFQFCLMHWNCYIGIFHCIFLSISRCDATPGASENSSEKYCGFQATRTWNFVAKHRIRLSTPVTTALFAKNNVLFYLRVLQYRLLGKLPRFVAFPLEKNYFVANNAAKTERRLSSLKNWSGIPPADYAFWSRTTNFMNNIINWSRIRPRSFWQVWSGTCTAGEVMESLQLNHTWTVTLTLPVNLKYDWYLRKTNG